LDAGVPQLVLPAGADQFINAEAVHKRGVGIAAEQGDVDATLVSSLLTDEKFRSASAEVKAEMAAMPTPVDVVPRLVELAS
jgi:UDP:flavonoid glycosyltransferase YjiC (YdhE family)